MRIATPWSPYPPPRDDGDLSPPDRIMWPTQPDLRTAAVCHDTHRTCGWEVCGWKEKQT